MKTSQDPRHQKRTRIIQELFAWGYQQEKKPSEAVSRIIENLPKIDAEIAEAAPEWPKEQINRIDLSILRLAVFELIIDKDIPFKVVVDEAVELAKEFGSETSPAFVNGVLGKIVSNHKLDI